MTEEKVIKKILQDRSRGDLERARRNAERGLEKWPGNFDISMELIQLCMELSDHKEAVRHLKTTLVKNPGKKSELLDFARESFYAGQNPILGRFVIESLIKTGNIDAAVDFLARAPEEYIDDLIKRSIIKSKGCLENQNTSNPKFADNELLLALLYIEKRMFKEALTPLGNILKNFPEHVQYAGPVLIQLQRDLPKSSGLEYLLGLASSILNHPDKMEKRFFRSLELEAPPIDEIFETLEQSDEKSENFPVLRGEVLIRKGSAEEGAVGMIEYLMEDEGGWDENAVGEGKIKAFFPSHVDRKKLVFSRLSLLREQVTDSPSALFLFCDVASDIEEYRDAVRALETAARKLPEAVPDIVSWLEKSDEARQTTPAQKLIAELNLRMERYEAARDPFLTVAEMDPSLIPGLIKSVEEALESAEENKGLMRILVELYAKSGNSEEAEIVLKKLKESHSLEVEEALEITTEVIQNCGATLDSVLSSIEISMANGDIKTCVPHVIEYLRQNPSKHSEFAEKIGELAEGGASGWGFVASLIDNMRGEVELAETMKFLGAQACLHSGEIEKGVFTFDQLMMFDDSIRFEVIAEYEKIAELSPGNTTLLLALFQLHFDEEQLDLAAHYLAKALESDPSQIRDVISRFNKIVQKDPGNRRIWEELLKSALSINHMSLAQETLSRAVSSLKKEDSAALHIYGARISRENGNIEEALKCLSETLSSGKADIRAAREELDLIIESRPGSAEAWFLKGRTYLALGEEEEAVRCMEKCVELSGDYVDKVRVKLEESISVSVKPWQINRVLGSIAWKQGRRSDALGLFRKSQKGSGESVKALGELLARYLAESQEDRELRKTYAENLRLEKRFGESVDQIEKLVEDKTNITEMVAVLDRIIEEEPLQFKANRLLARVLLEEGKTEESLQPALRMLSTEGAEPAEIEESARKYLDIHRSSASFLLKYAEIMGKARKEEEALSLFREALTGHPDRCEEILECVSELTWPESLQVGSRLLIADCHLSAKRFDRAFDKLEKLATEDEEASGEIIERIDLIARSVPRKEYFLLSMKIRAMKEDFSGAESIIEEAASSLERGELTELKIEMAVIADSKGLKKKASSIYSEILDETRDRAAILKKIEKSLVELTEEELRVGISRAEKGELDVKGTERLVKVALDSGESGKALEILGAGAVTGRAKQALLGKIYLEMEKPALAVAVLSSCCGGSADDDRALEALYDLGAASEMLCDYGRAASSFMRILRNGGEYLDARTRAERNYTRFLAAQEDGEILIIEKTGDL